MIENASSETAQVTEKLTLTFGGIWRGMRGLFPIALFSFPFGIAFGVAAAEHGMSIWQSITMSGLAFSGAAQFASLDFWRDPVAFTSLTLVVLAINARHIIMGAALSPWVNTLPVTKRMFVLGFLSDANFAMSQQAFKAGERDVGVLLGGGFMLWINWVLGTMFGAFAGALIGDPADFGLDVVIICFFATIVVGQMRDKAAIAPALIAAVVAVIALGWLPTGWNVILAAVAGGMVGVFFHAK